MQPRLTPFVTQVLTLEYTSGVIAWSKEDAPTDEQIKEVLNDFEQHAFQD
jgi:hypothetical protein